MKVYHITEADRIEPSLGGLGDRPINRGPSVSGGGGNVSRLTSVDITDTGILDSRGNKIFKVVDQDGKELFRGNEAAANAERDKLRRNIRTPAATTDRSVGSATRPDADAPAADGQPSKLRKTVGRAGKVAFKIVGGAVVPVASLLIGAVTLGPVIKQKLEDYADAVDTAAETGEQAPVLAARKRLSDTIADAIVQMLTGLVAGVVSATVVTRVLLLAPGFGWIAALILGGIGTITSYVLSNVADNEAIINELSEWLMRRLDEQLLNNLLDDTATPRADNTSALKNAMKDMIKSDPKMIQAFNKAKELKATTRAS
jgi:hypothetical protein